MKIGFGARTFLLVIVLLGVTTSACRMFSNLTRKGGTLINIEVKTDEANLEEITDRAVKVLQNRVNAFGADGEVQKISPNRIEIKIYGAPDLQKLKEILQAQSRFELRRVVSPPNPAPLQTFPSKEAALKELGGATPANRKILPYDEDEITASSKQWIILEHPSIVDGNDVIDASPYTSTDMGGNYQVMFSLSPAGAQKFGDWTGKNINSYLAIVLNDVVKSAPYIRGQIFDHGQIDGRFTREAARDLALIMKSGYVPASFQIIEEKKFE